MGYFRSISKVHMQQRWLDGVSFKHWRRGWNRKDRGKWKRKMLACKFEDVPNLWSARNWGKWNWW